MFRKVKLLTIVWLFAVLTGQGFGQQYKPDWSSLVRHQTPKWLQEGKFGIYTHWGIYAVHAHGSNTTWYSFALYRDPNSDARKHFERTFGPLTPDFGYKDLIPKFTAEKFNPDEFTDRIKKCGVDYIVFPAKCNLGMCYYDTKIGNKHPSLKYDMFGKLVESCKKKNIAISAYINVGISHQDALNHRDWCVLTPEGYVYKPNRLNSFFRTMCYNTEYKDYILEIVKEVVKNYPVDGLFLDCMHTPPCIGVECIREMKEKGIDWNNPEELEEFAQFSQVRMARRISETARKLNPDLLLYFNGIPYELQKDIGNYIEFECLPTGGWGYETLPVFSRYLRTLKKPVLNQTGRFHRGWGDFGGIRTEAAVEYDCLYGLANTMRTTVGDHLHPRGEINNEVFNLYEKVYKKLQKYQEWYEEAEAITEIGVVIPSPGFKKYRDTKSSTIAKGTARMLSELKLQFDILTEDSFWKEYKLLILPDDVLLNEFFKGKIKEHIEPLGDLPLIRRGNRLSVMPVAPEQWDYIMSLKAA